MKLLILGGGFAGLRLARKLANNDSFDITLIDQFNYHQFQPLFYQVATAGLDASNISFPLRKAFHNCPNIRIRMARVEQVLFDEKKVVTSEEVFLYDYLVIATGASTNFFGNKNLEQNALPMKSTVEALQLRHRLIQNFEDALHAGDEAELQRLMNVVVVGGGPTGVELAGAIAEMRTYVLPKDYPELDFSKMNIYLLEAASKTLGAMSTVSSSRSEMYLKKLGVQVLTNTLLQDYDGKNVLLKEGSVLPSYLVVWAAGIKGNIPQGIDSSLIAKGNRIITDRMNRIKGMEDVFAIGDIAYMEEEAFPAGHPQVAPVAIQQADLLASNLQHIIDGKSLLPFTYTDKGSMATVGRNLAVVDAPVPFMKRKRLTMGGFPAWLIWMGLHLMLILGVKNRFFVFVNWLYNYFTYDQNLRLIFKEFNRPRVATVQEKA